MSAFRKVTNEFSVSPQLPPSAMAQAAAEGFKLVINNRPDGEEPGQPTSAEMEAAARAAGLGYVYAPVVGRPTREQVDAVNAALAEADGPVLAYCRSGTRSITAWGIGQALSGARERGEVVSLAQGAGYDLSGVLGG